MNLKPIEIKVTIVGDPSTGMGLWLIS